MELTKRKSRLGPMARMLTDNPNKLFTLGEFCTIFNTAKSTVSEDIDILRQSFEEYGIGIVETIAGAAGGVRFRPIPTHEQAKATVLELSRRLCEPGRVLPGGFLYNSDISTEPNVAEKVGQILASHYYDAEPDFVLTMETKGIPVALMTAHMLNIPLVIARRDSKVYEGSAVKINYVAGDEAGSTIKTMALARRQVKSGQKALIIDDFVKVGGTLKGMCDMMKEFDCKVVGIGAMIKTALPEEKRVSNIHSLMTLMSFDAVTGAATVVPSPEYE